MDSKKKRILLEGFSSFSPSSQREIRRIFGAGVRFSEVNPSTNSGEWKANPPLSKSDADVLKRVILRVFPTKEIMYEEDELQFKFKLSTKQVISIER